MNPTMKRNLQKVYAQFFREMGIDRETGRLDRLPGKKFATYPYVGSKYGNAKKILFVGLDIGKDPKPGRIQSFSERRISIENKPLSCHNPHIAGTYMTALYFLKGSLGWDPHWRKITGTGATCQVVLEHWEDFLPSENPLSYCTLTNYHKFVKERRKDRIGSGDRTYVDRSTERKILDEEMEAFDPDIVVFQSTKFERMASGLKRKGTRFYVGQHPSARGSGIREPRVYLGDMRERSRSIRG